MAQVRAHSRVQTTLAFVLYVVVLIGAQPFHEHACSSVVHPRCTVCVLMSTVSVASDAPDSPTIDATCVGAVSAPAVFEPARPFARTSGDRAPPAA